MDNILIILTSTVNVDFTKLFLYQTNPDERLFYYIKSVKQWLDNTHLKICLVENSGYTFPELQEYIEKYSKRFEIISYVENELPLTIRNSMGSFSKGGSEIYAINHAYEHSKFKLTTDFIIKITCRYFVPELEPFLQSSDISSKSKGGLALFNNDIILGLKQKEDHHCEIIGSHIKSLPIIFDPIMCTKDMIYNQHVESVYMNRLSLFKDENIITCPNFIIEPTPMGGINQINEYL